MPLTFHSFQLSLLPLAFFCTASCANDNRELAEEKRYYSQTQQRLFQLTKDYKSEYTLAYPDSAKKEVQNKYVMIVQSFLSDSLGGFIDSMRVTVDSVIQTGWEVTTQFHTREIEFKYSLTFKDSMNSRIDSLYQFMRNLKPGEEVTLSFEYMGTGELNDPEDKGTRIFRIFAIPLPLNF